MKKNGFFTFVFSFIPGAGQMYQCYMKRGLSIMILFAISLMLSAALSTMLFSGFACVIFAYSFFDTFHIRNSFNKKDEEGYIQIPDEYVWGSNTLSESLNKVIEKRSYLLGIGFLLLGIYLLFNSVFYSIIYDTEIEWLIEIFRAIRDYLPALIISCISIGIGIKLMFGKKN